MHGAHQPGQRAGPSAGGFPDPLYPNQRQGEHGRGASLAPSGIVEDGRANGVRLLEHKGKLAMRPSTWPSAKRSSAAPPRTNTWTRNPSRRLRPQGVGIVGFSPVVRWFLIVLLVLSLTVLHALAVFAEKEVHMEKTNNSQISTLNKSKQFLLSFIYTIWAIGTSAAASALST